MPLPPPLPPQKKKTQITCSRLVLVLSNKFELVNKLFNLLIPILVFLPSNVNPIKFNQPTLLSKDHQIAHDPWHDGPPS